MDVVQARKIASAKDKAEFAVKDAGEAFALSAEGLLKGHASAETVAKYASELEFARQIAHHLTPENFYKPDMKKMLDLADAVNARGIRAIWLDTIR